MNDFYDVYRLLHGEHYEVSEKRPLIVFPDTDKSRQEQLYSLFLTAL